ncbi:hypothetical protein [Pedobacter namyangjuensis]|uniref:hypothetical protein n=1 Tax=Pedobacter namyangjuensis TaxID=600626 RepID=UPI0013B4226B|nr:hypothetical protein [Pedobacter namyangjuensis]
MKMENFEIELRGVSYLVFPLQNGTFKISEQNVDLGIISPQAGTLSIEWKGEGAISDELAADLGDLISQEIIDKSNL